MGGRPSDVAHLREAGCGGSVSALSGGDAAGTGALMNHQFEQATSQSDARTTLNCPKHRVARRPDVGHGREAGRSSTRTEQDRARGIVAPCRTRLTVDKEWLPPHPMVCSKPQVDARRNVAR